MKTEEYYIVKCPKCGNMGRIFITIKVEEKEQHWFITSKNDKLQNTTAKKKVKK